MALDINYLARDIELTDDFRSYVEEKFDQISSLTGQAQRLEVRFVSNESETGASGLVTAELTLHSPRNVVRSEASDEDKQLAFDHAFARLQARLRRLRERTRRRRPRPEPTVLAERVPKGSRHVEDLHHYTTDGTALIDLIGPSWSIEKIREELGNVPYEAVHQRMGRGSLLGLPTSDGAIVYPLFQFVRHKGKLQLKPGLSRMLRVLKRGEPWHVAVLLNTPAPELENRTPVEWEQDGGDPRELELLAAVLKREWEENESFERGAATSA